MKVQVEFLIDDESGELYMRISSEYGKAIVDQDGNVERGQEGIDACLDAVVGAMKEWYLKDRGTFSGLNADRVRGTLLHPPPKP